MSSQRESRCVADGGSRSASPHRRRGLGLARTGETLPGRGLCIFRTLDQDRRVDESPSRRRRGKARESRIPKRQGRQRLQQALADLDAFIGLESVKELVREVQAFVEIQQRRSKARLATEPMALHMIFKGNPGTGKTTVARIFGRMFEAMGVLPKGHLVECERADLVGEYIGHTAQKTREQIRQALGGILFIDEAYSLARGGEKDFGKEAIDTLVKAMEDKKDQLVLILAGYRREMELFLQTNPGLRSRFPIQIDFPDYKTAELIQIADLMLKQREYRLTEGARPPLARHA